MATSLLFVAATLVFPSLTTRIVRFTPIVLPQEESPPDWTHANQIFEREEKKADLKAGKKWNWPNFEVTVDPAFMTAELTASAYVGKFKKETYGVFLDSTFTKQSVAKLVNYHSKATNKKFVIVQKSGNIPLFINYGPNKWHFMFVGKDENIAACIGKEVNEVKIFVMRQTVIHKGTSTTTTTKPAPTTTTTTTTTTKPPELKTAASWIKTWWKNGVGKLKKSNAHLQEYNDYYYGDSGYGYDEYDEYDEYDQYDEYNGYNGYDEYDAYELYRLYRLLQGYNH